MLFRSKATSGLKSIATSVVVAMCFLVLAPIFQIPDQISPFAPSFAAETLKFNNQKCGTVRAFGLEQPKLKQHDCTDSNMLIVPNGPSMQCQADGVLCRTIAIGVPASSTFDPWQSHHRLDLVTIEADRPPPRHAVLI